MNHNIAGMPPSVSMSRGRNNMYFPCGGPGSEPHHMQRGPCYPMHDDKMGLPPGMACGMMGEFKSPLLDPPSQPMGNSKKKRRSSAAVTPQQSPVLQDLMPQQPSTLGDTIVASNPFDDTPPSNTGHMGHMPPHMPPHMHMSPMHSPHMNNMNIGPPMSSPMGNMQLGNMVGNPLSSPMGLNSPMGSPHMMGMMNGGPMMGSPMSNNQMVSPINPSNSPMQGMNNNLVGGPMTSPLAGPIGSPMLGSPHMNMHNGPMGSPMQQTVMNCGPSPNSCGSSCSVNASNCSGCGPPPQLRGAPCHRGMGPPPAPYPHMMGPKPLPVSAGKIYPPDQPMVFNPQNPNAPPIYPCGICHKEVHDNDQAILCESGCNFWFHRMCTGLTEPSYQLLTAEVYAEWVCDKCLQTKNIPLVKFKP